MTDRIVMGSQEELDSLVGGAAAELRPDPRVDQAFRLMRGEDTDDQPDWPPSGSATLLSEGAVKRGSTGQPWQVRDGQWVRLRGGAVAEVLALTPKKTDEERAREHRDALRAALVGVCDAMTAARRDGIVLQFGLGWDGSGRAFVQSVDSVKPL